MQEPKKKPYVTPRLRAIKLETGEVMANACKTGGSDINFGQPSCGIANPCSDLGS